MPKITREGGPSNAAAGPGEPGFMPAAEPEPEGSPDPTPDPGPGQDSTPPPSSQESSDPSDELPPPPPASALKAEHVEYVAEALGVPPEEAEHMTKPELVELAKQAVPRLSS
jgi:hypothetical protein